MSTAVYVREKQISVKRDQQCYLLPRTNFEKTQTVGPDHLSYVEEGLQRFLNTQESNHELKEARTAFFSQHWGKSIDKRYENTEFDMRQWSASQFFDKKSGKWKGHKKLGIAFGIRPEKLVHSEEEMDKHFTASYLNRHNVLGWEPVSVSYGFSDNEKDEISSKTFLPKEKKLATKNNNTKPNNVKFAYAYRFVPNPNGPNLIVVWFYVFLAGLALVQYLVHRCFFDGTLGDRIRDYLQRCGWSSEKH